MLRKQNCYKKHLLFQYYLMFDKCYVILDFRDQKTKSLIFNISKTRTIKKSNVKEKMHIFAQFILALNAFIKYFFYWFLKMVFIFWIKKAQYMSGDLSAFCNNNLTCRTFTLKKKYVWNVRFALTERLPF